MYQCVPSALVGSLVRRSTPASISGTGVEEIWLRVHPQLPPKLAIADNGTRLMAALVAAAGLSAAPVAPALHAVTAWPWGARGCMRVCALRLHALCPFVAYPATDMTCLVAIVVLHATALILRSPIKRTGRHALNVCTRIHDRLPLTSTQIPHSCFCPTSRTSGVAYARCHISRWPSRRWAGGLAPRPPSPCTVPCPGPRRSAPPRPPAMARFAPPPCHLLRVRCCFHESLVCAICRSCSLNGVANPILCGLSRLKQSSLRFCCPAR